MVRIFKLLIFTPLAVYQFHMLFRKPRVVFTLLYGLKFERNSYVLSRAHAVKTAGMSWRPSMPGATRRLTSSMR
jgi:hypothetical protein